MHKYEIAQMVFTEHAAWGRNGGPDILVARYPPLKPIGVGDTVYISYYDTPTIGGHHFFAKITQLRVLEKEAAEFAIERQGGEGDGIDSQLLLLQVNRAKARVGVWRTLGECLGQRTGLAKTIVLPIPKEADEQSSERTKTADGRKATTLLRSSVEHFEGSLKDDTENSFGFGVI